MLVGSRMCSSCLVSCLLVPCRRNSEANTIPSPPCSRSLRCVARPPVEVRVAAPVLRRPRLALEGIYRPRGPGWLKKRMVPPVLPPADGRTVPPCCADRQTGGEARPSKVLGGHRAGRITGHHNMLALHVGITFPGAAVLARGGTGLLYLGKTTWSSAQRSTAPISSDSTVRSASLIQSFSAVGWGYGILYGGSFSISVISVGLPVPYVCLGVRKSERIREAKIFSLFKIE